MISLYDASIPVFIRALQNMDAFLDKGAAWFAEQGRPESELTTARLYEDMAPLTAQIQRASDTSKGVGVRIGEVENVAMADEELTIADLKARIAKTRAFVESVAEAGFAGAEERTLQLKAGPREFELQGMPYLVGYALPNLYFHMAMAYAILRHNGVDLGKQDFLGQV